MHDRFFTGNVDADRLILMEVEDDELFSIGIPTKKEDIYNKYAQKLCNEDFFRNRTMKRFPWTLEYKREKLSWKKYYEGLVFYVSQMKDKEVMEKFGHTPFDAVKYTGNSESQYNFFMKYHKKTKNGLLLSAAGRGELGIVKYLVENGANVHFQDEHSLQSSSQNGHLGIVKWLVEQGANVNSDEDLALRWAAEYGHLNVVKYLAEQGANIQAKDDQALRWASEKGHLIVVKWLVEHGANINAYNDAAILAGLNEHLNVVEYLTSKVDQL